MRTETQIVRIGENVGPVDWSHEIAKDMPDIWREAEQNPDDFVLVGDHPARAIYRLCMYDGWPYWRPMPAMLVEGPICSEWKFFNSYGIRPSSIRRKEPPTADGLSSSGGVRR